MRLQVGEDAPPAKPDAHQKQRQDVEAEHEDRDQSHVHVVVGALRGDLQEIAAGVGRVAAVDVGQKAGFRRGKGRFDLLRTFGRHAAQRHQADGPGHEEQRDGDQDHRPDQQRPRLRLAEQEQREAQQRIDDQDVAGPDQEGVDDADQQQGQQPAHVEGCEAPAARLDALHQQEHAQPEEQREERVELPFPQKMDQPRGGPVIPGHGRVNREHERLKRVAEDRHVDQQDAKERKAAQDVDDLDAFGLLDRGDLRFKQHRRSSHFSSSFIFIYRCCHWMARRFSAASETVSVMRRVRVSGRLALTIHSRMPRFTERGNASQ
jgi:hypothetical protein